MTTYLIKRLLATIPTLLGITLVTFFLVQLVPGGPVEAALERLRGSAASGASNSNIQVTEELRSQLERQYGFDRPVTERYLIWMGNLARLDFGRSYTYEMPVLSLIREKLPVSVTLGLCNFILVYLISIPLGIAKAVRNGSRFDVVSSLVLFLLDSIPPFALGILLIVFLCGGSFLDWFPLQGLRSHDWNTLSPVGKLLDYAHHAFLPLVCYVIGNFAVVTLLMKNALIEQFSQDYRRTAEAKGLSRFRIVYKHCLRNALIPIATGLGSYVGLFLAGSLLIEEVFGLDGIGRLSYESVLSRDYPVVLAIIVIGSLASIVGNILSDLLYVTIDPRIDFA